jgi:hypothetical protein
MMKDLDRTRILHGMLWGMVAAPIAALVPLTAMVFSLWPAPMPITVAVVQRAFGVAGMGAYVMAGLGQILYGGIWGAFLGFASAPLDPPLLARPSNMSIGLGMGLFRAFVASVSALLYVGWGAFGVLLTPFIALGILITDLAFGATVAYLITREEDGRVRLPFTKLRMHHA